MSFFSKTVVREVMNYRKFSYKKGEMVLDFTIDPGKPAEIINFVDILEIAREDVRRMVGEV